MIIKRLFHTTLKSTSFIRGAVGTLQSAGQSVGNTVSNTVYSAGETVADAVTSTVITANTYVVDGIEYSIEQSIDRTISVLHNSREKCIEKGLEGTNISATVDIGIIKLTLTQEI